MSKGLRFSPAEDETVRIGCAHGEDPKTIGEWLGRSAQGVWARGKAMGLTWPRRPATRPLQAYRETLQSVDEDRDFRHVGAVLDLGGFPRAEVITAQGQRVSVWLNPSGRLWIHTA